jgi:hypothetical protein
VTPDGPREHPMHAFNRLDKVRRRLDDDAFMPSPVIERLVLQVIGGWEQVKAEIYFHALKRRGSTLSGVQTAMWRRRLKMSPRPYA